MTADGLLRYNGHSFWDCETWMFPTLLAWHPTIAQSLLEYRVERLPLARAKAKTYKPPYAGAMFPWESAVSGAETCPSWADTGQLEQHITGDVAFAARQFFAMTRNATWANTSGFDLASGAADFWISRVELNATDGLAHIKHVIPPDEYATGDDSVYTNCVAAESLRLAAAWAARFGRMADPRWAAIADKIPILWDAARGYHPEYAGYTIGTQIKQADVVLLAYPLMLNMSDAVRQADLAAYESVTDPNGPAMTWAMHAIGHLDNGRPDLAASLFNRSFANVQMSFAVWTETPQGGTTNFLTGAGGFLQGVLMGYAGLRIHDEYLTLRPALIEGTQSVAVRGLRYRGATIHAQYDAATLTLTLAAVASDGDHLSVLDELTGSSMALFCCDSVALPLAGGVHVFELRISPSALPVHRLGPWLS